MRACFLLLLLPEVALATPRFAAHDPEHAEIARRAWEAAVACAGWEAPAHETVRIEQGYVTGGFSGGAWVDEQGLYRIRIGIENASRSLVHEVSHAWARSGPAALTEGRANLLADCIVTRVPGLAPLSADPGTDLAAMPDLRTWTNPHGGEGDPAMRRDAYVGATRLLRTVALLVDTQDLWPRSGHLGWDDLDRLLIEAGPFGFLVRDALAGGVDRQRQALSDDDRDGLPWLAEVILGTDPDRWDSTGDGWWDGAQRPFSSATPLPRDGTPVCTGLAGGREGGVLHVVVHGELRGNHLPWVAVHAGEATLEGDPVAGIDVPPGASLLLSLQGPVAGTTGGLAALAGGRGLVVDRSCRSTPRFTLRTDDPALQPHLEPLAAAITELMPRADELLEGPGSHRLVLAIGAAESGVVDGAVHLAGPQVTWAAEVERFDALAALAVAVHRVWRGDETSRRWEAAEALARTLIDDPPDLALMAVDLGKTEDWTGQARRCEGGWFGLLAGRCRPEREGR